ncbi:(2Fe-2S)-binding protein [Rhodocytophaga aerolata]|uniref:(2Fe-2S)-binding protein n=1 Tax=Rhodocytophaga aerolata TaxID=455078 RepID=A0ABT8RIF0_9BACT|nr:(2Fe-2S)-binding protein [Rhodocytophaga aerolata]MDO1451496.1 (2Fe-2S)-binding protein [Rhodocytophaga aerolata]
MTITVNGKAYHIEADPQMPLLWAIRDFIKLKGTKYGCGLGQCGACTVHMNGQAVRSCTIPLSAVGQKEITTIEGLSADGTHPLQQSWQACNVPQCGFCQAGQIMAAAALLKSNPSPSEEEVRQAMNGNLCRCGTYLRICKAVLQAAQSAESTSN